VRYSLKNNALEDETAVEIQPSAKGGLDQALGLDDGRLLIPASKALQVYGAPLPLTLATPRSPRHLSAGATGHIWYSMNNADHVLDQIVLARLDTTLETEATISVSPGRVTHMASGPDGSLAVITEAPGRTTNWIWTIVLLDPKGAEKKRIVIDDELTQQANTDFNVAFIALTPTTIVVDAGRHGLFGWNASTGARIK
jgi:hypothetical protein